MGKIVKDWKRPPRVEVKWRDATGKALEWTDAKSAASWEPAVCYSSGFLIAEDELGVRLAQDLAFNPNHPDEMFEANGIGVLPRACIERVSVLRGEELTDEEFTAQKAEVQRHRRVIQGRRYRRNNQEKVAEQDKLRAPIKKLKSAVLADAQGLIRPATWGDTKHGAKERGLEFSIERKDFPIPATCPVLGIPLDRRTPDHIPSLDRIDNKRGYVPGNVIVVSLRANKLKRDATIEELQRMAAFYGGLA